METIVKITNEFMSLPIEAQKRVEIVSVYKALITSHVTVSPPKRKHGKPMVYKEEVLNYIKNNPACTVKTVAEYFKASTGAIHGHVLNLKKQRSIVSIISKRNTFKLYTNDTYNRITL